MIDRIYNPSWFHTVMERGPAQDERPELATNEDWRSTMRRARASHGWSQADLGSRVGTSQNMISLIERGEVGSSEFILPISRCLEIPPPTFYENEDDRAWMEIGRVLRARDIEVFRRALSMVEAMIVGFDRASGTPEEQ